MIEVADLVKHYSVAKREGGFAKTVRAFFKREHESVKAVDGISFSIAPGGKSRMPLARPISCNPR